LWAKCAQRVRKKLTQGLTVSSSGDRPAAARPWAIGINCTNIHRCAKLIQKFESAAQEQSLSLPRLVVYPDGAADRVYDTAAQKWVSEEADADAEKDTPNRRPWHEEMAGIVREVRGRGAWEGVLAGGCCHTTPAHIAALRNALGFSVS
jgi:homocysteine S-methyltransferase